MREKIVAALDVRRNAEPGGIAPWEVVGFNGTPESVVGLKTPIVHDVRVNLCYKVGTDIDPDPISIMMFEEYSTIRLVTQVPPLGDGARFNHDPQRDTLVVGYIKRELLDRLNRLGGQGDGIIDFNFDPENPRLRTSNSSLSSDENHLKLFVGQPDTIYFWLSTREEGNRILYSLSRRLMQAYDSRFIYLHSAIPQGEISQEYLDGLQRIGWDAQMCAYDNDDLLIEAHLRLAWCFKQTSTMEDVRKRFEGFATFLLEHDLNWEEFADRLNELPASILANNHKLLL